MNFNNCARDSLRRKTTAVSCSAIRLEHVLS